MSENIVVLNNDDSITENSKIFNNEFNSNSNKKYCRLCAKERGTLNIFEKSDQSPSFSEQVSICTQIVVSIDDGLPSWLCIPCSKLLSTSYLFRQQCHMAQKQLREIFNIFCDFKIEIHSDCEDLNNDQLEKEDERVWEEFETYPEKVKCENGKNEPEKNDPCDMDSKMASIKLENGLTRESGDYDCMHKANCDNLESHLSCKGRDCWAIIFNKMSENVVKEEIDEPKSVQELCADTKSENVASYENNIKRKKNVESIKKSINGKKIFNCGICNEQFLTKSIMKQHLQSRCRKKIPKIVKKRRKRSIINRALNFPNDCDVEEEECIKSAANSELYKCKFCGKKYKSRGRLRKHKHKYCSKKEPRLLRKFMCDQCGNTFKQKSVLVQHMRTHASKMFSCNVCGKHFTRSSHVLMHMRIHNNYKPFVCETCGRPFVKSSDLARHKRIHSDARNFSCPLCPRTFKRSGDVTSHLRVHTGDRPYKCEPCSKSYTNYSSLRKHRLTTCTVKKQVLECHAETKPIISQLEPNPVT